LGKLYFFFNTQINGFYLRYKEPYEFDGDRVLVMGCRYLNKDGSCQHYHLRPTVCRKWPIIEHFGRPRILKGCGFRAIPREAKLESKPEPKQGRLNILK
jgi:Fe-S-cluster containining protein